MRSGGWLGGVGGLVPEHVALFTMEHEGVVFMGIGFEDGGVGVLWCAGGGVWGF